MSAEVKGKVLCVEDNMDDRELILEILRDFDVTCVGGIAEACRLLTEIEFDLVIIDEHLPDGSGLALCGHVRERNAKTPVLFVTGDAGITISEALSAGAKAFLRKGKVTYVEELLLIAGQFANSATA